MEFPSVSIRSSWPFHWDPLTGRLLIRTLRDILPTGHSPGVKVDEDSPSFQSLTRYPHFCFPTAALEIRPTSQSRLRTTSSKISCPSFEHFISTPPAWIRQLIPTIYNDLSYPYIFDILSSPCSFPIAVCHGSVQFSQATSAGSSPLTSLFVHSSNAHGS
jgi:hypothetical protein